jgi:hypothetical protein
MKRVFLYSCAAAVAMCVSCKEDNNDTEKEERDTIEVYSIGSNNAVEEGSNRIVMVNHGGGLSYWVHPLGTSTRANDTITVPFKGSYTIVFEENTIDGIVQTKKTITVTTLDTPVDPMWALLSGADGKGKTWIWATENSLGVIWGGGEFKDEFWEAGYDRFTIPADSDFDFWDEYFDFWDWEEIEEFEWFGVDQNEMTFSFNGSAGFKLVNGEGEETSDVFVLNTKNKTLSNVASTPFLWSPWTPWDDGEGTTNEDIKEWFDLSEINEISTYDILKLTENELILSFEAMYSDANDSWGKRFIWFFKKK